MLEAKDWPVRRSLVGLYRNLSALSRPLRVTFLLYRSGSPSNLVGRSRRFLDYQCSRNFLDLYRMTSVASIPVYMLPGAPALQPPRTALETGDPNLATEVLPAPPTLSSVLQASGKRDPRKPVPTMSYLPQHDPGTTYAGVLTGPIIGSLESVPEVDGPRRKRVRLDKGCVLKCSPLCTPKSSFTTLFRTLTRSELNDG
jgi:hypothetical protein